MPLLEVSLFHLKEYMKYLIIILLLFACVSHVIMDPSVGAVKADDYTLIQSICEAAPGRGIDVCRAKEGTPISSTWVLVLPKGKGGEVSVQYRDVTRTYAVTGTTITIPLKDFFDHENWEKTDAGTAVLYAKVIYNSGTGDAVFTARGFAFFIVTDNTYDPMPIDSGYSAFQTQCKIQYSTSGRSAIGCK